ncbi:helix-turn-helix domain-containing protein [Calothrix rhizosoleniae]|uniref:AlbA family DNA-binding domain-containing protein n=1 Tax=Calothrix rhizosoleniae TaxID=888997 RepID=UPI000B4A2832|nr:RNA-binding domain-containing protein [Calothrix rhizosoleniae]
MKSSKEWLEIDIIQLIENQVQDFLELDYKVCGALQKKEGKKKEISKIVSSFANSNGGVIVYGVNESGNLPESIDVGFDPNDITN